MAKHPVQLGSPHIVYYIGQYLSHVNPELTPWWSFLLVDGAHHKKPHSLQSRATNSPAYRARLTWGVPSLGTPQVRGQAQ